jgi:predicted RNA-binding Zn-ribbon protein involved in translation (DUF1610 family)
MTDRTRGGMVFFVLTACPQCGHALWSEVRVIEAFRFVVYFDDDERSDTHAEHVLSCPGCGKGVSRQAPERHGFTFQPRSRRYAVHPNSPSD